MAVHSSDPDVLKLLYALGMPEHCIKFVLVAETDCVLKVRATYFPTIDSHPVTKTFELIEKEA